MNIKNQSSSLGKITFEAIIQTKDLSHALSLAASIVEKRNVQPILNNTKILASDNYFELTTTDTNLSLQISLGALVKTPGEVTVSSALFNEIIRKIPDSEVKLTLCGDQLEIISKNSNFNLSTIPANEFPTIDKFDVKTEVTVNAKEFTRILDYTKFSMSFEETRYNLNGIYLHVINQNDRALFSAASTDGHRLSVASIEQNEPLKDCGLIIPRKTALEILKITKDPKNIDHSMKIEIGLTRVKFSINNIFMISKLIDGTFPQYNSFIPVQNNSKLVINTKMFSQAIERAALVTLEKHKAVKIILNSENGLILSAHGESKGKAREHIGISNEKTKFCEYNGDKITIGFNPKYLLDVLSAINDEYIEITFKDDSSPALIKLANSSNDNFIIMPVKV